jgi:uncharacterized protein YjiS (DUF1127 family)
MSHTKLKPSFIQTSSSLFHIIAGGFIDAGTRMRTRRMLHKLDNRTLKDIGISRCEIDRIVNESVRSS